jgi:hypothetical protein
MSTFPGSPQLLRGALVGVDPAFPVPTVVLFQYNPHTLTRSVKPRGPQGGGSGVAESQRLSGAPEETIQVEVELDSADALESSSPLAVVSGLHPQLAALEMLAYPKSLTVITNTALMASGVIEVIPTTAPITLLVWGPQRILPVRLTDFTITEEAFDPFLNPIRARVALNLRVLSYNDLALSHPGYPLFLAHQVIKETMAAVSTVQDVSAIAGQAIPFL